MCECASRGTCSDALPVVRDVDRDVPAGTLVISNHLQEIGVHRTHVKVVQHGATRKESVAQPALAFARGTVCWHALSNVEETRRKSHAHDAVQQRRVVLARTLRNSIAAQGDDPSLRQVGVNHNRFKCVEGGWKVELGSITTDNDLDCKMACMRRK